MNTQTEFSMKSFIFKYINCFDSETPKQYNWEKKVNLNMCVIITYIHFADGVLQFIVFFPN